MIKNLITSNQINLPEQLKIIIYTFLGTVIPFSLIVLIFKLVVDDTMDLLTRDPLSITNAPFYTGFFQILVYYYGVLVLQFVC
jgi:hypothetical protein